MDTYEKAVALWRRKQIRTDAELAEALNGHSVSFAYHSGNLENEHVTYNDTREIFDHDGVTSYTDGVSAAADGAICGRCLKSATRRMQTSCSCWPFGTSVRWTKRL